MKLKISSKPPKTYCLVEFWGAIRGALAADSAAKNNFRTFLPKIFTVKFCVFLPNFFAPMLHKIISENFFVSHFFCVWYAVALFFCKKQLHLCARHAVSTACSGRFLQETRVFSVCFVVRLQGVVTNRWGRAACFLTITGVMLPLLNWEPEYQECAARFFAYVCRLPGALCWGSSLGVCMCFWQVVLRARALRDCAVRKSVCLPA